MKLKKYIKLKEDLPEEPMTEREQEIYNTLVQRVRQNAEENVKTKMCVSLWKILTPAISFAVAIAITLTCVFTLKTQKEFLYSEDYIVSEDSNFFALKQDIKEFNLNYVEPFTENVVLNYDSKSNDKLYYNVLVNVDYSSIVLIIVINEKI